MTPSASPVAVHEPAAGVIATRPTIMPLTLPSREGLRFVA